jgi:signal transduction histidine kinase/CheY-like chemotaxis protein
MAVTAPRKPGRRLADIAIARALRALKEGDLAARMPSAPDAPEGEVAVLFNDIAERQGELWRTNEQLRQHARQLSEQVKELEQRCRESTDSRAALEQETERLALRSQYKSEFLANMSHELRAPLNSLLILAQLLAENAAGTLTPKQVEYAQTIRIAGNDLLVLINDILDLSKVEAGRATLSIARERLADLRDYLERAFREIAVERGLAFGVTLQPGLPAAIQTDAQRLRQILQNLLSNAFKFTEKGAVSLAVTLAKSGWTQGLSGLDSAGKVLAFSVADTGIGIPQDKHRIIFEAFHQAGGLSKRQSEGAGLGLSISSELARLLGGEIRVASRPGKGSTFTLYLPIAYKPARNHGDTAGAPLKKRKAARYVDDRQAQPRLAADPAAGEVADSQDDRHRIRPGDRVVLNVVADARQSAALLQLVRALGFKGLNAANAHTALVLANEYLPNVVNVGVKGSDVGGWAIVDLLKEDPVTRDIPVSVIAIDDRERTYLCMGARGIVRRPSAEEALREVFRRLGRIMEHEPKALLVAAADKAQRDGMADAIAGHGRRVMRAASGKHALKLLRRARIDCTMIGQRLADMAPLDLVREISHVGADGHACVVMHPVAGPEGGVWQGGCGGLAEMLLLTRLASTEAVWGEIALCLHEAMLDTPSGQHRPLPVGRLAVPALAGRKVLLVDDDVRSVFALAGALEAQEMRVLSAQSGLEGIETLRKNPDTDIILMDLRMPGQDGYQTIRAIRGMPPFAAIPVIAVTASAMVGDREKSIEAGASDYLAKPVDVEQLLSVMEMWLADRRAPATGLRRPMHAAAAAAAKPRPSQMRTRPD